MRIIHVSTVKGHPCFSDIVSLQSRKHDVIFIVLIPCGNPRYKVISSYHENGVQYVYLSVRQNLDFAFDSRLESAFSKFLNGFNPDIIHVQLFSGVDIRSVLRASSGSLAKKIITLHTHSLFCLPGTCFDNGQVCPLNSIEDCSCGSCRLAAGRDRMSLSRYNQVREERCKEIISLADVIICCSQWQRDTIQRLLGKEEKTGVLYHGVTISRRREYKNRVKRFEIEAAGIGWKSFARKITQHGFGKQTDATTIRFFRDSDSGNGEDKAQKVFGDDLKKIISIVRRPLKNVRRKSSLPSFGYIGSLWGLKGIGVLLDAVKKLRYLKFRVLMGIRFEPTDARAVDQLKQLRRYPPIRVMANLRRGDFYEKIFSQIDYLIIPSVCEETGPMTLFEAFYYKTPVIVSNRSSMIEKTREGINALVFDNAHTLAEIMKNIIEGRILLSARVRANFPIRTSKEYAAILENIYSGKTVRIREAEFHDRGHVRNSSSC